MYKTAQDKVVDVVSEPAVNKSMAVTISWFSEIHVILCIKYKYSRFQSLKFLPLKSESFPSFISLR